MITNRQGCDPCGSDTGIPSTRKEDHEMAIVHPVQEGVVMRDHVYRLFDFETESEEEALAFVNKAEAKGWKVWCVGYTAITHTIPPRLPHGGCMVKLVKPPQLPSGEICRCTHCEAL
jgi:hypothetical protein